MIALVITIIVLLILAGVTIITLTGENGILKRATKAGEETEKQTVTEELKLLITEARLGLINEKQITNPTIEDISAYIQEKYDTEIDMTIIYKKTSSVIIEDNGITTDIDFAEIQYKGYKFVLNKDLTIDDTKTSAPETRIYTIKYDANGGTGAPTEQEKTYGKTLMLSSTIPTRTGYVFLGWSKDKNETKAEYEKGSSYTSDEDITLWAIWKINEYEVTYDKNFLPNNLYTTSVKYNEYVDCGGIETSRDITTDKNVANGKIGIFNITKEVERTDNLGVYYGASKLTEGKTYTWSVYVKASKAITMTIGQEQGGSQYYDITTDWKKITKTFIANNATYNAFVFYSRGQNWKIGDKVYIHSLELQEGNSLNITTTTKQYNSSLGTLEIPSRNNYTFNGWYTDPIGGTKISEDTKVNSDVTYYAHWTYND